MNIYVSTSALKKPFDLEEVLKTYSQMGLQNIELGSSHKYCSNLDSVLKEYEKMNFIIHNYFPPHKEPFALNLSSIDETIRVASVEHAFNSIELCVDIKSPIYSIHAGMVVNPRKIEFFDGFTFDDIELEQGLYNLCFNQLIKSCYEINDFAKRRNIRFAIENSGGHPKKYKYLMMTRQSEFEKLINEINDDNFGILFDIGHFNLSEKVYKGESKESFIARFKDNIFQVHLHHNDGSNDQHLKPTVEEMKFLSSFSEDTIIVLESMKNEPANILQSLSEMESYIK